LLILSISSHLFQAIIRRFFGLLGVVNRLTDVLLAMR